MGITKSQLRRIIREEKRRLDERRSGSPTGSALIDFARAYMSLGDAVASQVDAIVEAFVNANGDADDELFVDTVFAQNSNAIDMAHDKLVRLLQFGRFGNDLGDGGDAVREALEAAKSLLDAPDEGIEATPGPGTPPGISFPGLDD